jgi:hypothetical protein
MDARFTSGEMMNTGAGPVDVAMVEIDVTPGIGASSYAGASYNQGTLTTAYGQSTNIGNVYGASHTHSQFLGANGVGVADAKSVDIGGYSASQSVANSITSSGVSHSESQSMKCCGFTICDYDYSCKNCCKCSGDLKCCDTDCCKLMSECVSGIGSCCSEFGKAMKPVGKCLCAALKCLGAVASALGKRKH